MLPVPERLRGPVLCLLVSMAWAAHAMDNQAGAQIYKQHCASCHDQGEARSLETLRSMIPGLIEHALTEGRMKAQGDLLSDDERQELILYLAGSVRGSDDWEQALLCEGAPGEADLSGEAVVTTFGLGHRNHRYLSREQAGLSAAEMKDLELAWVLAFPNITMMRSQPAVVGDTLFVSPVESQKVYAFNIAGEPCLQWVYRSDRVLRTSLTFSRPADGPPVLVFGDMEAAVHAVAAETGTLLWRTDLKRHPESIITGTPQVYEGRVYATVSQFEIMIGAQPQHVCCKASGAVAALDLASGKVLWHTPTLPPAAPQRDRGDGQMIWGPSGAPVWTSPAIDARRGLLYVGTGEANSEPAHEHTDAILALRLDSGEVAWSFQASADDIFLAGCWRNPSLNCPPEYSINRDVDFGASVIIATRDDGKEVLLAGQKSSVVWALDPDDKGKVLWRWSYGTGTTNGGVHWAMAYDGDTVYVPLNDPGRPRPGFTPVPGLYALDVNTGEQRWGHRTYADCDGRRAMAPRCEFLYGFSAAPVVIEDAVVTGSVDGYLRIFAADDGEKLFEFDTLRTYDSITGVPGQGGAIDSASLVAANGLLLVNSGYGMFGQPQGNVLLAFKPAAPRKSDDNLDHTTN